MKRLMKKLEDIMVAITFAEAGEYDQASKALGAELKPQDEELAAPLEVSKNKPVYQQAGKKAS
jgi:hypothetical protein